MFSEHYAGSVSSESDIIMKELQFEVKTAPLLARGNLRLFCSFSQRLVVCVLADILGGGRCGWDIFDKQFGFACCHLLSSRFLLRFGDTKSTRIQRKAGLENAGCGF